MNSDPAIFPRRRRGAKVIVINFRPAEVLEGGDFPFAACCLLDHLIPALGRSRNEVDPAFQNSNSVGREMKPQCSKVGKPISDLFLDFFRHKPEPGKEGKRQVHRFQRPGLEAKVDLRFNPSQAAGGSRVVQFAFENLMALDDFEDRPFIPVRSLP